MGQARRLLGWLGAIFVAFAGCVSQPNLKPPEQPEVLATPGPNDKRYSQPATYPIDVLANDPVKQSLGQAKPLMPLRGGKGGVMPPGSY